jgi:hypothetical protein
MAGLRKQQETAREPPLASNPPGGVLRTNFDS